MMSSTFTGGEKLPSLSRSATAKAETWRDRKVSSEPRLFLLHSAPVLSAMPRFPESWKSKMVAERADDLRPKNPKMKTKKLHSQDRAQKTVARARLVLSALFIGAGITLAGIALAV